MESINVVLKLTLTEAREIVEMLKFNVGVQETLIAHAEERIAESDDGHGNPKEFQQKRLHELRGKHKQISYLLAVVNDAVTYTERDTGEPF